MKAMPAGLLFIYIVVAITIPGTGHALGDFEHLEALRVDDGELDTQRGGWMDGNGVRLSFSLEQFTVIDGELRHHRQGAGACADCGTGLASVGMLLRNDASGLALTEFTGGGGLLTILQNSVDNVRINHVTVLDAMIGGMRMVDLMPAQRLIQAGVLDALPAL